MADPAPHPSAPSPATPPPATPHSPAQHSPSAPDGTSPAEGASTDASTPLWRLLPIRSTLILGALLVAVSALQHLPIIHRLLADAPHWHETPHAALWFFLLGVPYCAFGLPRQALCMAAGLGFGLGEGLGLSCAAYATGALLIHGWARRFSPTAFRARQKRRLEARFAVLSRTLRHAPFRAVLTLRLMPVGSALLVSMAAGIFELPAAPFFVATLLGGLPQNLVFTLAGSGARIGHVMQLGLAGALFLLSGALGAVLLRQNRPDAASDTQAVPQTTKAKSER